MSRRYSHFYKGEFHSLLALSKIAGLSRDTLKKRIESGMDIETAVTTPLNNRIRTYPYKGKNYLLKQLPCDIPVERLYDRIHILGWSIERAVETPVPLKRQCRKILKQVPHET